MPLNGDEGAFCDAAMDELSRTGLSGARARAAAELRLPAKIETARQMSEPWPGHSRDRGPSPAGGRRCPAQGRARWFEL